MPAFLPRFQFAFFGALFVLSAMSQSLVAADRPNVVLIMTDNHGAWTLGCYGNQEIRTPNIDRLAAEGTLFENAFASNPVCSPTRATTLTGLIPSQHGVHCFLRGGRLQTGPDARNTLEELTSIPEVLKREGYRCGLVGKWHLGGNQSPQESLDDYWITMPHGGTSTFYDAQIIEDGKQRTEPEYLTDFWTKHAVRFIQKADDKPFFLFLAYNGPYSLSRLLLQEGRNRHAEFYRGQELASFPREKPHPWQLHNRDYQNNPVSIQRVATEVSGVDDGVGQVMAALQASGLDENTIVIFMADQGWVGGHGGFFGMGDHTRPTTAVDRMMQIPLIWRHPGKIAAGKRSDQLVANYDIYDSLLDYLGIEAKKDKDEPVSPGASFALELKADSTPPGLTETNHHDAIFYEFETLRCIRTSKWKYTERFPNGPHELYDLKNDPQEFNNLYQADNPKVAVTHRVTNERNEDTRTTNTTLTVSQASLSDIAPKSTNTDGTLEMVPTALDHHSESDVYLVQQQLHERLHAFFAKYASPEYDLLNGGGSQSVIYDGVEEEIAQADPVAPPALPAGYETKQFTLPEGFSSQLVAGPPLVDHPTMGCFDDTGRLFVCDGDGVNMSAAELEENLPNRIRMLEDTDGDGVFDRSTVFADKMTFPMGGAWHDGALYVASPPNIWRLEDTTGDGVADKRDILVDKFGFTGNAASIHGCFLHPSGRIYWCDGYHGHEFQDQDGNIVSKRKGSYIFSAWPDGSDVRIHCGGGMDNPVEVDFTDAGDVIGTVNILYTRPRIDCLVHWQYGGAYPHREAVLEELQVTGDLLEPIHKFGHVAISGTGRYRSGVMNHQWGGNFFATQFNLGKVVRVELERSGSTFACTEREFLSCGNRDFHPTDVIEDADGSLLVVDTGGWFYRGCPTSQIARPDIKGGIYRIRRNGMTTQVDPRGNRIDWSARTAAQLMQDLKDTRHAVQEKAIQECVRRGEVVVPLLASIVRNGDIVARRNAIWTLTRLLGNQRTTVITAKSATSSDRSSATTKVQTAADAAVASSARQAILTRQPQTTSSDNNNPQNTSGLSAVTVQAAQAAILSALSDRDAEIRQAACHALSVNPAPTSVDPLLQAAVDPAANVRREAFVALGRTRSTLAFNKLLEWNDHHSPNDANADREERHARLFALLELSQSTEKNTIGSNQPQLVKRVQSNAEELIVFDQLLQDGIDTDSLITCLKVGSPDVMLATSRIIRLRAAKKQLSESSVLAFESAAAERVQDVLAALSSSGDQSAIRALLQAFGQSSQVLNRIAGYLQQTSDQPQLQTAVLQLLTSVPIGTVPELNTILGGLLAADSPDVRKAAIDTVAHLKQASLLPELSRLSSDNDQPAPVRLAALRAVVSVQGKLDDSLFQRIVELTLSGTPDEQSLGAQLLGSVSLTAPQLQVVAGLLASAGPQQLNDLVPLFNRALSPELAVLFLDGLENARSLNSLPMIEVSEIVKRFPQELHPRANALLDRMKAAEQHKLLKLDSLVASLKTGDPVRGQAIFFSEKSKCATCHVVGNQGKRVGPDLTTIGANRAPKDLLESIVFPSASIVRQYEPYTLVTTAGRTWSGLVIKDTSEEVTLQQSTGEPVTVPRSEIEELVQSTVSIMPKGLDEVLTPQQIVDVVAWLQTLRQAP